MSLQTFKLKLIKLDACKEAIDWVGDRTESEAWRDCERSEWMLWYLAKINYDRKIIVDLACDCAETVLKFVPDGEDRPRKAIETARAWIRGEATLEKVRKAAAYAADAAAYAAYDAADAAYDAAYAAAYAAYDAADAAYAADAAAYAADAAYLYCRTTHNKYMADMIRKKVML